MKVLASDFDGTLFFNGHFKRKDLKAIKQFQNEGNLFGLCSGRPYKGVLNVCKGKIDFDFFILCSGALVLDKQHQEIYKSTISQDCLKRFYQQYRELYKIYIQANYQIYTFEKQGLANIIQKHISSIDEIEGDLYGISMETPSPTIAKKVCEDIIKNFPELTPHQNKEYIDITEKGCSKGLGIQKIKEAYHINRIAGIGDSFNDIPMLETVNQAFTFHSSPKSIQDICDHVVDSVEEALTLIK